MKKNTAAAFNRLELLVVVVVVLVVAALAVAPTGPRPRQRAERIRCVNNLKEIGTAVRVWENDNHNPLPASNCWAYYSLLTHGVNPSILTCPADERKSATNSEELQDNSHLSYFAGIGNIATNPQSILGGDRNVGLGTVPDPEFGYSPGNGAGNDLVITNPVCWSLKMHSRRNIVGAGNILLGDGSAQQCTSAGLRQWVTYAGYTNNAFHVIFP